MMILQEKDLMKRKILRLEKREARNSEIATRNERLETRGKKQEAEKRLLSKVSFYQAEAMSNLSSKI